MSVPVHKRKPSNMEYLNQTIELLTDIILMVGRIPEKHKQILGVPLMKYCTEALRHGKIANAIYVQSRQDLDTRIEELSKMYGSIDSIPTLIHSWVKVVKLSPNESKSFKKTIYKKEQRVTERCELILRLIKGLQKSDRARFKKQTSGIIGVPNPAEDLTNPSDIKAHLRGLFFIGKYLGSISHTLRYLQVSNTPTTDPKDLPDYPFDPKLLERIKWDNEAHLNTKDNQATS